MHPLYQIRILLKTCVCHSLYRYTFQKIDCKTGKTISKIYSSDKLDFVNRKICSATSSKILFI